MFCMGSRVTVLQTLKCKSLCCFLLEEPKLPVGNGNSELPGYSWGCGGGVLGHSFTLPSFSASISQRCTAGLALLCLSTGHTLCLSDVHMFQPTPASGLRTVFLEKFDSCPLSLEDSNPCLLGTSDLVAACPFEAAKAGLGWSKNIRCRNLGLHLWV